MARNIRGGEIREAAGGNIVDAGPRRFPEALDFQLAQSLLVFEKPEPGANDFTGIAESAIANIRLNKLFEVKREVDVLGWHGFKMQELATIVNFEDARYFSVQIGECRMALLKTWRVLIRKKGGADGAAALHAPIFRAKASGR